MSPYDELRRAFDDLAGDPPLALGRKEAVMSRVSRRLQRQALVRGAGVLALAVALGTGAVQTTLHFQQTGSEGHDDVVVATSTPSTEPTRTGTTEPSHEPSTHPSSEPTGATSPEATAAPATEPTPEPTHAPTKAPTAEETSASGPLVVSLQMSPATVDTSTDTHALVTARDGDGRLLAVDITWGDGKTFHFSPPDVACPRTTHLDGSFNHRYASPGSYAVHVTVTSGDCAAQEQVTREGHVTVTGTEPTASASQTNGPAQPTSSASPRSGDNPAYVYITATGADTDGWVSRVVVHWGDGAELAYSYSTGGCTDADGTNHPVGNQQTSSVPGGHHYAAPGQYDVTVTTTSVACDGTHAQTGSASHLTVSAP